MPILGYGVFQVTPEECERCVLDVISVGYRSIDTAQAYRNEEGVGNAITSCGVPRNELFITTKIWISNAGYEKAKASIEESLAKQKTAHEIMRKYGVQIESWGPFAEGRKEMFTNPVIMAIGEKHGKSVAQVILRFLIQNDVVVIPKSIRKERMIENLDVFNVTLTPDDMAAIANLDQAESAFFSHYDPQTVEYLTNRGK
jgi:diketogulonate reductase-like aldo/keto reductase